MSADNGIYILTYQTNRSQNEWKSRVVEASAIENIHYSENGRMLGDYNIVELLRYFGKAKEMTVLEAHEHAFGLLQKTETEYGINEFYFPYNFNEYQLCPTCEGDDNRNCTSCDGRGFIDLTVKKKDEDKVEYYNNKKIMVYNNQSDELFVKDERDSAISLRFGITADGLYFTTQGCIVEPHIVNGMVGWKITRRK